MQELDLRVELRELLILEADFSLLYEDFRDDLAFFSEILFLWRRVDLHLIDQISQKYEKMGVDPRIVVFLQYSQAL